MRNRMAREIIVTPAAPPPGGAYSQVVAAVSVVATAGQVGSDPITGTLATGIEAQTRQALANVAAVLAAAGCSWRDVIKTTCFLSDIGNFAAFNGAYASVIPEPWPARSTIGVALAGELLVEIEALAVRPGDERWDR